MGAGRMNRRVTFFNESYTVDAGGGVTDTETERWDAWAEIQDRSGNTYAAHAQDLIRYDYRVKVRFDRRFNSNTGMIYEGQVCSLEQMSIESEGFRHMLILRYSRTDTFVDIS